MEINKNLIEVLNDLIQINNDRVEGYNRANKETDNNDTDLNAIFNKMADESRQYVAELTREIVKLGGEPASGTTASGKIYRAWMDVKSTFSSNDRYAILASCEHGEDAAQKAYKDALSDEILSGDIRRLIENQKASLRISHDTIKKYRDMNKNDENNITGNSSSTGGIIDSDNYITSDKYTSGSNSESKNVSTSQSEMDNLSEADRTSGLGNESGTGNIRNNL